MKIGIVIPTVAGREAVFDRVIAAYGATRPTGWEFDIVVPEGFTNVGEAWNDGMSGLDADYAFLAIDDAEPLPGWAQTAVQTADAGYIPAPRQEFADGTLESCGSMGFGMLLPESADGTPCRNAGIIFIRRDWWDTVGAMPPLHYGCDDYWTWKAALHGYSLLYRSAMRFVHHHELAGTDHVRRAAPDHVAECIRLMSEVESPARPARAIAQPRVKVVA